MAKTRLSQASFVEYGYGQVEPNHLSGRRTGQIYAQLPAKSDIDVLENGQFAKYDYAKGVVDFEGEGEWMLVYNEVKLYEANQTEADFAMKKSDYSARIYNAAGEEMPVGTTMVPRLIKTNVGDIYTTNMINIDDEISDENLGDKYHPDASGILQSGEGDMTWEIVKVYTLADGQPAVKLMRIK